LSKGYQNILKYELATHRNNRIVGFLQNRKNEPVMEKSNS